MSGSQLVDPVLACHVDRKPAMAGQLARAGIQANAHGIDDVECEAHGSVLPGPIALFKGFLGLLFLVLIVSAAFA